MGKRWKGRWKKENAAEKKRKVGWERENENERDKKRYKNDRRE